MQGRQTFTRDEADQIRALLREKAVADRNEQKRLRGRIRRLGFYISDWDSDAAGLPLWTSTYSSLLACS